MPATAQITFGWRMEPWNTTFDSFDSTQFYTGTNARFDDAARNFILTPSVAGQAGRLMLRRPLTLDFYDIRFDAYLGVRTPAVAGGADGIILIAGHAYDYPVSYGGELNFTGSDGYGFELDTYQNPNFNDPSQEHLAVVQTMTSNHLAAATLALGELKNGAWHSVLVSNRNGAVTMMLDGVQRLTYTIPGYAAYTGYLGFGASSGTSFNAHLIDNVRVSAPSRRADTLGIFGACDSVDITRTVSIVNNHPDGTPLTITSGTMVIPPVSGFSWTPFRLPVSLAWGAEMRDTIRYRHAGDGSTFVDRLVMKLTSSTGEIIEDTVRVVFVRPVAKWSGTAITLLGTLAGGARDTALWMHNTGLVPAVIDSLRLAGSRFSLVEHPPLPHALAPGDSVMVRVRFMPADTARESAVLTALLACGDSAAVALDGAGFAGSCRIPEGLVRLPIPTVRNHPNPFRPTTDVEVRLFRDDMITLEVIDATGRCIVRLAHGFFPAGTHTFVFDGSQMRTGACFARLVSNDGITVQPMLLLR